MTVIMLLLVAAPFAYAETEAAENEPSAVVLSMEKLGGTLGNLLGHVIKIITFTDESRIKKAKSCDAAGQASNTPLFTGEAEISLSAETWRAVEVSFESEKVYADPFGEAELDLLLYGGGRLYTVPGFWDGGNTWRVRFVCPAEGTWQFITVCSDKCNSVLNGRTGIVVCTEYSGDLDVYKHGFVTTRYGEKYLTYEDGTPFYYLGDTHWQLAQEPAEMVATICEKRVEQGFTVYESQPNDSRFNNACTVNVSGDGLEDIQSLDVKFRIISESGLTHANSQFFWPLSGMNRLIENHGGWTEPKIKGNIGLKSVTMPDLSDEATLLGGALQRLSRYMDSRTGGR